MVYLIFGLQPCYKAAMLGVSTIEFFVEEFSSHGREIHLFLTISMAAVTSRANQQFGEEKKTACNDIYAFPGVN